MLQIEEKSSQVSEYYTLTYPEKIIKLFFIMKFTVSKRFYHVESILKRRFNIDYSLQTFNTFRAQIFEVWGALHKSSTN